VWHQEGCLARNVWTLLSVCWESCAASVVKALVHHSRSCPVVARARQVSVSCQPCSGATAAGRRVQLIPGMGCVASRLSRVVVLGIRARSSTRVAELCVRERVRGQNRHAIRARRGSGLRRFL
jgi:hypothetical protein